MSTQYNGIGNIVYPSPLGISSSTNTSPIQITATAHGLTTGDGVDIVDHTVNTNANGQWLVTVTGANTFTLQGSTGNGVGGATGLVHPITFGQSYPIPSDGDADAAASVNVALEALGDRAASLLYASGAFKLSALTLQPTASPNIWRSVTPVSTTWAAVGAALTTVHGVEAGDIVRVSLTVGSAQAGPDVAGAGGTMAFSLGYAITTPGGATTPAEIPGSAQLLSPILSSGASALQALTLKGSFVAGANGVLGVYVGNKIYVGTWTGTTSTVWAGEHTLEIEIWRATSVPQ
jgi:hypothetical protein